MMEFFRQNLGPDHTICKEIMEKEKEKENESVIIYDSKSEGAVCLVRLPILWIPVDCKMW